MKCHSSTVVLEKLILTQKTLNIEDSNKLAFEADKKTSKFDVIAFFSLIGVAVKKVNIMVYKSEQRLFKGRVGNSKSYKKIIVTFNSDISAVKVLEDLISSQLTINNI